MKKILALLMILAMLLSMSGCLYIDELRRTHAVWETPGETILYQDALYRRLPDTDALVNLNFTDNDTLVTLTDKDVPLLLKDQYLLVYPDRTNTFSNGLLLGTDSDSPLYCRADRYEEAADAILNADSLKHYYYYKRDTTHPDGYAYADTPTLLDAGASAAIEQVMTEGEERVMRFNDLYNHCTSLYRSPESMVIGFEAYEIYSMMDGIYILDVGRPINTYEDALIAVRKVPEELQEQFAFIDSFPLPLYEPEI